MRSALALALALVLVLAPGCLPGDTRPPPGKLYTTVEPGVSLTGGLVTSDGWTIEFERLLMGLGRLDPEGSECNVYGDARYSRLFDFTAPGSQKVSEVYALGECDLGFRIGRLGDEDPLGAGATEADRAFMREPGTDAFVQDTGASVYVRGTAVKGEITKRFEWTFRLSWELTDCPRVADADAGMATVVELRGSETLVFPLEVRAEELFRETADDAAPIRFDRLAKTDADGDGAITLEEIASLPAPVTQDGGLVDGGHDGGGHDGGGLLNDASAGMPDGGKPDVMDTFAGYLYTTLVPRMVRVLGGGACAVDLSPGGGGHHGPPI